MFKYTLTALAIAMLHLAATAQTIFYQESFDVDLASTGFVAGPGYQYAADGSGDVVPGWDDRSRIRSASLGGAALLAGPIDFARLTGPQFDANGTALYLTFYHYLRSAGGTIAARVLDNNGVELFSQQLTPGFQNGDETSAGKFEIIDISVALAAGNPLQLEFVTSGGAIRHWLLDDITVTDTRPTYPTFPRYFGEELTSFGYSFVTDSLGSAAVPFELVIDFAPDATPDDREDIRMQLGAIRKQTCVCDRLEVWELPGGTFFDPATGEPLGDPGEILERTLGSGPTGKVDNLELNRLNYNELQNVPPAANPPLNNSQLATLGPAPTGVVKVAILDTGIDIDHPGLTPYLYRNDDGLGDGVDNDGNCYADDILGWNFVDDNNNPADDHSHGSHVAGIVAQNVEGCENCTVQLVPYKTHDSYGVGTLFAAACATYQAGVNDDVDVINMSFGFYGAGSDILRAAIDTAGNYGAIIIAAAGNDSLNLVAEEQNPATLPLGNIIGVGTFTNAAGLDRAAFSNFNPALIDLFAPGIAIQSTVPDDATATKTGTSMSTPAVAAAAALRMCDSNDGPVAVRAYLLGNAEQHPAELGDFVLDGNVLSFAELCERPDLTTGVALGGDYSACLKDGTLSVRALRTTLSADVRVYAADGRVLFSADNVSLAAGEELSVDLSDAAAGDVFLAITRGERLLVQRLVKR